MKVYLEENGETRLVGRADVPAGHGPVLEVPVPDASSVVTERFTVGTVTHIPVAGGAPVVERAVLMAPGQIAKVLPGWVRLAS